MLVELSSIENVRSEIKGTVVFTNGCFDLLHIGHLRYLREARSLGDVLWVGINSDNSVRRLKGETRPIVAHSQRAELLLGLDCVDYVTIFEDDTPLGVITELGPDVLVKGGDWPIDKIVGGDFVRQKGGRVLNLEFVNGQSTTAIERKILRNHNCQ